MDAANLRAQNIVLKRALADLGNLENVWSSLIDHCCSNQFLQEQQSIFASVLQVLRPSYTDTPQRELYRMISKSMTDQQQIVLELAIVTLDSIDYYLLHHPNVQRELYLAKKLSLVSMELAVYFQVPFHRSLPPMSAAPVLFKSLYNIIDSAYYQSLQHRIPVKSVVLVDCSSQSDQQTIQEVKQEFVEQTLTEIRLIRILY
jgi:hypothetical protein